jgi:general secretion pathway protein B
MSYILDALKKLEHEKTQKSRKNGMVNISGALLESDNYKSAPGSSGRKILFVIVLTVLVTFAATWYFLKSGKNRIQSVSRSSAAPVIAPVAVLPAPSVLPVKNEPVPAQAVPPAVSVQQVPPVAPVVTVKEPLPRSPARTSLQPKPVAVPLSTPSSEEAAALLTIQELRKRMKERKGLALPADLIVPAPADIKLSGIAWQDERRARRAVVNGFLMQEGGIVSGARITDIYQDRVRFTSSGKFFEIPLISSGVPGPGN